MYVSVHRLPEQSTACTITKWANIPKHLPDLAIVLFSTQKLKPRDLPFKAVPVKPDNLLLWKDFLRAVDMV